MKTKIEFEAVDGLIDDIINNGDENNIDVLQDMYESLGYYAGAVFVHRFEYRTGIKLAIPEDIPNLIHFN